MLSIFTSLSFSMMRKSQELGSCSYPINAKAEMTKANDTAKVKQMVNDGEFYFDTEGCSISIMLHYHHRHQKVQNFLVLILAVAKH
jgi:hypothetical protein